MKLTSHDIIRKPVITEKSMAAMAEKKYTFIVHMRADQKKAIITLAQDSKGIEFFEGMQ